MEEHDNDEPSTWVGLVYRLITKGETGDAYRGAIAYVGVLLFMLAPMLVFTGFNAIVKYLNAPGTLSKNCLDLKEIRGQVYKADQCNKTIELMPTSAQPTAKK